MPSSLPLFLLPSLFLFHHNIYLTTLPIPTTRNYSSVFFIFLKHGTNLPTMPRRFSLAPGGWVGDDSDEENGVKISDNYVKGKHLFSPSFLASPVPVFIATHKCT